MFLNLTRDAAVFAREENDTDAPFLVNMDLVKTINRTHEYATILHFIDGRSVTVEESVAEIITLLNAAVLA